MSTYLVISCTSPSCGAVFKAERVWQTDGGPLHCVVCGTPGCYVEQLDPEGQWLEVMAQKYATTTEQMALYVQFYQEIARKVPGMSWTDMMKAHKPQTQEGGTHAQA